MLTCTQRSFAWQPGTNGPQEKFAMLRHAAACFKPEVGVTQFSKTAKVANPRTKHKGMHVPTHCKDEHNRIISWVFTLLLLLLTLPLFVRFIDIHDCQMAQCLITHIVILLYIIRSYVRMCPNKLKALSTWHADRGRRTKKTAIDDKIGTTLAPNLVNSVV